MEVNILGLNNTFIFIFNFFYSYFLIVFNVLIFFDIYLHFFFNYRIFFCILIIHFHCFSFFPPKFAKVVTEKTKRSIGCHSNILMNRS